MILETLILGAIALSYIASAIYMFILTISEVVSWFNSNRGLSRNDMREVGFTLQRRLDNGQFNTIQGVFNKSSNVVTAAREVNSSQVDGDLSQYHRGSELAIYE